MKLIKEDGAKARTRKLLVSCDCGCGTQFRRYKNKVGPKNFLNCQHAGEAERRACTELQCGPYLELFTSFMGSRTYRDRQSARRSLRPFFLFLNTQGIVRLDDVTAATITKFKLWGLKDGYISAANDTSTLSTFFQWAIMVDHYEGENPVIPALHAKRTKPRTGRPYAPEEISMIRQLLEQRGNARLRAFFEIAAESGMRTNEICRLRMQDVCLDRKELFVGLPNKTMTERTAYFYLRTEQGICDSLKVRRDDGGHDFLFHNYLGEPLQYDSIREEFGRILCINYSGVFRNETGLQTFSLHRLRHTHASTLANHGADASTIMRCAGWVSPESLDGYVKVNEDCKRRSFHEAIAKAEARGGQDQKEVLSPDEFLFKSGARDSSLRCV